MRPVRMPILLATAIVAALAACGCADGRPRPTPSPSPPAFAAQASAGCNVIDTSAPRAEDVLVPGAVAVSTGGVPLETAPDPDRPGLRFAKAGLSVAAGHGWSLAVPTSVRRHLHLGWGSPPRFASEVHPSRGCPVPEGWATYPGGFLVDRAGCYPLDLRVDGVTTRARVPIGTPC